MKSLAEGELGPKPADANEWLARGDRWWNLAEKAAGRPKAAMRRRAVHAYQAAMPDLAAGAAKSRVEKRLAQATGKPVNPSQPSTGPAKYHGQVSLDPRTHTIVLTYNFCDKRQLQDFDLKGSGAALGNGVLRVPAGKSIQHLAAFKTVTVRGVLAANPGGAFLTTASGLSVSLQEGTYKLANRGGSFSSAVMNHLTPPLRFELAVGSEQVVFQWLNDSNPMNGMGPATGLGGIPPEFFLSPKRSMPAQPGDIPVRHIELNGGGSGLVLSELSISGELETKQ